jgi:hypothetical protein
MVAADTWQLLPQALWSASTLSCHITDASGCSCCGVLVTVQSSQNLLCASSLLAVCRHRVCIMLAMIAS